MQTNFSQRRNWLKKAALLSGGLAFIPGLSNVVNAAPYNPAPPLGKGFYASDEEFYELTEPELRARLLANENPFGPSPKAKQAIRDAIDKSYQYGMRGAKDLADKVSEYEGVKPENLLFAPGSTPVLLAAALHFSKKGSILSANPTYEDLLGNVEQMGGKVMRVALLPDYTYDLDTMEKAVDETTALVYICNPNNPTATIVDNAKLKGFCERVSKKTVVMVDEAYIDYVADPKATSVMDLVKKGNPNIIIARTFSKLYGMAGMRFGYAVGHPQMIKTLSGYTEGVWGISSLTMAAASASYQDAAYIKEVIEKTNVSKNFLYETLKKEGYTYVPSSANFVIFPVRKDSKVFASDMDKMGVGLRSWRFAGKDWCRISIGTLDEMKVFAQALPKIV